MNVAVNKIKQSLNPCKGALSGLALAATIFCPLVRAENIDSLAAVSPRKAQIASMIESTHIISEGGGKVNQDSIARLLGQFYFDQYRHFQDPRAPYFMFLTKDRNLAMGVGGLIRMRGYFDWDGSMGQSGFAPYLIPVQKNPTEMKKLWSTPAGTGLFMTVIGSNSWAGDFIGFIQADFSGYDNRGFKLKKAYLQNKHWTVGYATTTFEDTAAEPPTVDGSGSNGVNKRTNVLMRYTNTFRDRWTVAGSFEFPSSSIADNGTDTKACADYVPDIAAMAQYQWDEGDSHVRISGLGRVLTYRDMLTSTNHNIFGWGLQLSSVIKVAPPFNLFGIVSYGRGHASYTADLGISSFDLVTRPGQPGVLYAPNAAGYVAGAQYYFSKKVFTNLALSEQRYYPKYNPDDTQYKYGLYGAWNVFWNITPRFEVAGELLLGKRKDFNGEQGTAKRFTAMFMFSF